LAPDIQIQAAFGRFFFSTSVVSSGLAAPNTATNIPPLKSPKTQALYRYAMAEKYRHGFIYRKTR
jgi:hypothetical protein